MCMCAADSGNDKRYTVDVADSLQNISRIQKYNGFFNKCKLHLLGTNYSRNFVDTARIELLFM